MYVRTSLNDGTIVRIPVKAADGREKLETEPESDQFHGLEREGAHSEWRTHEISSQYRGDGSHGCSGMGHIHMYVCTVCIYMYTYRYVCIHVCTYVDIYVCMYIFTYVQYMNTHVHVYN